MQELDTTWLNDDWLAKLAERKRARRAKEQSRRAPPLSLQDKRDADSTRLRLLKQKREAAMAKATEDHLNFAAFVDTMRTHEATFNAPIRGVLDVDLVELVEHYGLGALPYQARFMLVEEVHECVRRTNRRCHGVSYDEIPWDLPKGTRFTLCEFKEAIGVV